MALQPEESNSRNKCFNILIGCFFITKEDLKLADIRES